MSLNICITLYSISAPHLLLSIIDLGIKRYVGYNTTVSMFNKIYQKYKPTQRM